MSLTENIARMPSEHNRSSTAWGRLKNAPLDRLEEMGLPSKGDSRYVNKFRPSNSNKDR